MKYLLILDNTATGWCALPESVGLAGGKPMFRPDIEDREQTYLIPAIAVKICRLGKCIASRWAERYYKEFAPALILLPPDSLKEIADGRIPGSSRLCFDGAVACGDWAPVSDDSRCVCFISAARNIGQAFQSEPKKIADVELHVKTLHEAIAATSRHNTLKVGDILVLPQIQAGVIPADNDIIQFYNTTDLNHERLDLTEIKPMLRTKIK